MEKNSVTVLMHLAGPIARSEVRHLVRELGRLTGIVRVSPAAKVARLLSISYDPSLIALRTLVANIRRSWTGARLVWRSGSNADGDRLAEGCPSRSATETAGSI